MGGGGVGGLQFLLLGRRLLVKTSKAALTAPVEPTGEMKVVTFQSAGSLSPLFCVYCLSMWWNSWCSNLLYILWVGILEMISRWRSGLSIHSALYTVVMAKTFNAPPQGNVLVLHLLSGGVKDALPAVDLHADVQLKVDVSFSCWAAEAPAHRCAWPAFTEQLTHSRKPRGLLMRCLAKEKICNLHLFIILKMRDIKLRLHF